MVDVVAFSQAQKMVWAKQLLDPDYVSDWKAIEVNALTQFHYDKTILWKTSAPISVLNSLKNTQLAETIQVWYLYRDKVKDNLGYGDYILQDPIWWNKKIRLKTVFLLS